MMGWTAQQWHDRRNEVLDDLEYAREAKPGQTQQADIEALQAYLAWLRQKEARAKALRPDAAAPALVRGDARP